jgi:hypothetical protein
LKKLLVFAVLPLACSGTDDPDGIILDQYRFPPDQRVRADSAARPDRGPQPDHQAATCLPKAAATTKGGGRCGGLNQAWTARGINVGYYPFLVTKPIPQYSGDFSGKQGSIFAAGGGHKGVILQIVPAGSYVGLSSTGPWYQPASDCFTGASCGAASVPACVDSSPPLRPALHGHYWGYAYDGASHMQGWFRWDPASLRFAGFDPEHPCARGPANVDFEAASACGQPTVCKGPNVTCGASNPCSEGADDCGRAECGAASGGPLTPAAHRMLVRLPPAAVKCTTKPPHPSVLCLPNGGRIDFFFVYPFGAYLYWAQNSTTKHWLHYGDVVQVYYHNRDSEGVLWHFVEVLESDAPSLTPASDGSGAAPPCSSSNPSACSPCKNGGTCGWIQAHFLEKL